MVSIEGVDYSANAIPSAALRAAGKRFVCRYLAHDSRGITADEVRELTAGGIEIVANHEYPGGDEAGVRRRWMGGYGAGEIDAQNAQAILVSVGLPPTQPIYFSTDWDATPEDQIFIDAYLRGAASVVGIGRVGIYGGYWPLMRAHDNGTARWFWQTYAWSGNPTLWHPACHIQQYDNYGHFVDGTDVDLDRAVQPHYGQRSDFLDTTTTTTTPHPVLPPKLPKGMSTGLANRLFNPRKIGHPDTGHPLVFARGARISEVWLAHVLASNPDGKTWRDYSWPAIEEIVKRGDGRIVVSFSDGFVWERPA